MEKINSIFYPYSITINKCKGSCNTINNPYAKSCVPDTIKNINAKVFNLMSRTNETRHIASLMEKINSIFYPYSITINKYKCSCNTINNPYAKSCDPDTIKNINVKVFNLMSKTNETRHIEWHKA